ncbi:MAG: MFS transporter [Hyphomonadaceae bacterium]|nr:MFS transporter [Hyphomonadaceae bacterium]
MSVGEGKRAQRDLTPFIIGGAIFMQTLDSQTLTTILPAISRSLEVSPLELNLAITIYYVGAAACLPISGWCADRFGTRRVFQTAIIAFAVCSLFCALAQEPLHLALARGAMGAATAGLMPVGRLLLIRTSERTELVRRLAYLTIPSTIGPLLGPLVGGAFATYGSWRWMFLLNIPVGIVGLVLVTCLVPDIREEAKRRLDIAGAVLAGAGLSAGLFWIDRVGRGGGFGAIEIAAAALMVVCGVVYFLHARRTEHPVLDFALLRIGTFRAGVVGGFFFRLAVGCQPFLLSLLFQLGFGMTAFASGGLVVFTAAGALLVRWLTATIVRQLGFKRVLLVNGALSMALGIAPLLLTEATPFLLVAALLFVRGFFRSLQLTTLNVVSYVDVPRESMSGASSFAATTQQLTHALSIAFAVGVMAAWSGGTAITVGAISAGFIAASAIGLLALASFAGMARDAGADVSGKSS